VWKQAVWAFSFSGFAAAKLTYTGSHTRPALCCQRSTTILPMNFDIADQISSMPAKSALAVAV
jgi:hypothetical protein